MKVSVPGAATKLISIRDAIMEIPSPEDLIGFMQRDEKRVLWNFKNVKDNCEGTMEFRGSPQLQDSEQTKVWMTFVQAFISLAIYEVSSSATM